MRDYFALVLGKKEARIDFGVQVSPPTTRAKSRKRRRLIVCPLQKKLWVSSEFLENYCIQKLSSSEIIIKCLFGHDASYKSCKEEITKYFQNP